MGSAAVRRIETCYSLVFGNWSTNASSFPGFLVHAPVDGRLLRPPRQRNESFLAEQPRCREESGPLQPTHLGTPPDYTVSTIAESRRIRDSTLQVRLFSEHLVATIGKIFLPKNSLRRKICLVNYLPGHVFAG